MNKAGVKTVSILGCGWLGWPLAKALKTKGYLLKGSTTTQDKLDSLRQDGVEAFQIDCQPEVDIKNVGDFFSSDVLFFNIPYRRNLPDPRFYFQQTQSVLNACLRQNVPWIIFASSTSVYPDHIGVVSEDSAFVPDNDRSRVLLETEQMLLEHPNVRATVLRFAGLIGPGRHPGQFASKVSMRHPDSPVNLVHLDDCVKIIVRLIQNPAYGIFNVCADEHPSRRELYTQAAIKSGNPPPVFEPNNDSVPVKIVTNEKIKKTLGYSFQHADPMD